MQLIGSKMQSTFLGHIKLQVHKIEKKCNVGQHKCNNFRPWTCTQPQIKMLTLNEKNNIASQPHHFAQKSPTADGGVATIMQQHGRRFNGSTLNSTRWIQTNYLGAKWISEGTSSARTHSPTLIDFHNFGRAASQSGFQPIIKISVEATFGAAVQEEIETCRSRFCAGKPQSMVNFRSLNWSAFFHMTWHLDWLWRCVHSGLVISF